MCPSRREGNPLSFNHLRVCCAGFTNRGVLEMPHLKAVNLLCPSAASAGAVVICGCKDKYFLI